MWKIETRVCWQQPALVVSFVLARGILQGQPWVHPAVTVEWKVEATEFSGRAVVLGLPDVP